LQIPFSFQNENLLFLDTVKNPSTRLLGIKIGIEVSPVKKIHVAKLAIRTLANHARVPVVIT
jgi:hypothetical protein